MREPSYNLTVMPEAYIRQFAPAHPRNSQRHVPQSSQTDDGAGQAPPGHEDVPGANDQEKTLEDWAFIVAKVLKRKGLLPRGSMPTRADFEELVERAVEAIDIVQARSATGPRVAGAFLPVLDRFARQSGPLPPGNPYENDDEPEAEGPRP